MMIYTHTDFKGHNPVGTSAVVVAPNRKKAAKLLKAALKEHGLEQEVDESKFQVLSKGKERAVVLNNGDY